MGLATDDVKPLLVSAETKTTAVASSDATFFFRVACLC